MTAQQRHRHKNKKTNTGGFALLEALIAMALMGLVVAALATVTSQWLPNWNHGMMQIQHHEQTALGLERIVADLAAAEFISAGRETRQPFFDGGRDSVTFVRIGLGPNAGPGLDFVRIAEEDSGARGEQVVRMRTPFVPIYANEPSQARIIFTDPVVLLRTPSRLSFSYAGADRIWRETWRGQPVLPDAVRITLRDATSQQTLSVSTAVSLHSNFPTECLAFASLAQCLSAQAHPAQPADTKSRS